MVSCIRPKQRMGESCTVENRFHISNRRGAKRLLKAIRMHWDIENQLHWVLGLAFDKDHCRVRKDHGPENLAILQHIAVNLLKQENTSGRSIKGKRLLTTWKQDYLLQILQGLRQIANGMRVSHSQWRFSLTMKTISCIISL